LLRLLTLGFGTNAKCQRAAIMSDHRAEADLMQTGRYSRSRPNSDIGQIEISQRSSAVLSFVWVTGGTIPWSAATSSHCSASRRRGGRSRRGHSRPSGCGASNPAKSRGLTPRLLYPYKHFQLSTLSTEERLDRAQLRHTIRSVHRHCRAFQRGRRGATLR
jgi:hypothetical protein